MFGKGVGEERPEVRDNDAEGDYAKSVWEDDVGCVDGLSGFRDFLFP